MENGDYILQSTKLNDLQSDCKFRSLNDLIGYYTVRDFLNDGQRLEIPVPPPEPVLDKNRVIAILKFTEKNYADELNFEAGDIFTVHNDIHKDWLWVTAHRTGEQGMVFHRFVKHLDGSIDVNTMYPWFHPDCSKLDADNLLQCGKWEMDMNRDSRC